MSTSLKIKVCQSKNLKRDTLKKMRLSVSKTRSLEKRRRSEFKGRQKLLLRSKEEKKLATELFLVLTTLISLTM